MNHKATKILLVDDEPNILVVLEHLFAQKGYQVKQATNGELAIEVAKTFKPDIILLDVMMPGLDGFATASILRNEQQFNQTKIVFLTAKGTNQDKINGYTAGGELYITKPFDNDTLMMTIQELETYG